MFEVIDAQVKCGDPVCENISTKWLIFTTGERILICNKHDTGDIEVLKRLKHYAKLKSNAIDIDSREF